MLYDEEYKPKHKILDILEGGIEKIVRYKIIGFTTRRCADGDIPCYKLEEEVTQREYTCPCEAADKWKEKISQAPIISRTLDQALARADKVEQELPKIVQVVPSDWDIVILAKEVRRLQKELKEAELNVVDYYKNKELKDV